MGFIKGDTRSLDSGVCKKQSQHSLMSRFGGVVIMAVTSF